VLEKSKALGGSAGLQSTSQHGTVFFFELPYDPCIEGTQGESDAPLYPRSPGSATVRGRLNSSLDSSLELTSDAPSGDGAATYALERDVELGHCSSVPTCMLSTPGAIVTATATSTTATAAAAAATVETSACEAVQGSAAAELRTPDASPKRSGSSSQHQQQQHQQSSGYSPLYSRSSSSPTAGDAPISSKQQQLGHVLLVDDCASIRKHLARVLRSEGYKVFQVVALVFCSSSAAVSCCLLKCMRATNVMQCNAV
jgi:hypothetical protein